MFYHHSYSNTFKIVNSFCPFQIELGKIAIHIQNNQIILLISNKMGKMVIHMQNDQFILPIPNKISKMIIYI